MINVLRTLFSWPQGIVVGNLIASFIVWSPHFIYMHINHRKLHARLERLELFFMPYEVRKASNGDGYEVINKDTGDVKAHHSTKEDADRQVRLLHAIEHDPGWEPTQNG